jgi:cyclohexa-1,5-dienecarbonyl-CoA hydratase
VSGSPPRPPHPSVAPRGDLAADERRSRPPATAFAAGGDGAVHLRFDGRIARLTLDRPPLNVLDLPLLEALDRALAGLADGADAAGAADLAVVVLGAAGDRAFSAGVAVEDHAPGRVERMLATFHGAVRRLRALPAITVAAVRGHCLGGGCELAASCDLVVAAEGARFGQPEVDLGCFPPLAAALYPSLVGPRATLELLLTGRPWTAEEARARGLVGEVVAGDRLDARIEELAAELAGKSAPVLRLIKRAVGGGGEAAFARALAATERLYVEELCRTADMAEGLAAFLEKRPPRWTHQ